MMRLLFVTSVMIVCVASSIARAQGPYTGPWDSAADAAAEKAVARLGAIRHLEIRGTVLTIPSLVPRGGEQRSVATSTSILRRRQV